MEKKIGIITVYGENNYGNKLQNYASIKIYESMNLKVETIKGIQSAIADNGTMRLKKYIKKFLSLIPCFKKYKYEFIREKKFKEFSNKYLNTTKKLNLKNNNERFFNKYKYLSIGSDQVWNDSDFNKNDLKYFLASQAKNSKKIALSASFGKKSLKKENEDFFIQEIKKFSALSCREYEGCKYIKEIAKIECHFLMDPTLYICKKEWEKIEKKPKWLNEKDEYIFAYFLGGYDSKILKKYNLQAIDILDKNRIYFTTSPEEFIYLIHHAKIIMTDSFHACVFSIIFDKNFEVHERVQQNCSMTSRIESLFKLFDAELYYRKEIQPSKWINKDNIINIEKKRITEYLKKVLK